MWRAFGMQLVQDCVQARTGATFSSLHTHTHHNTRATLNTARTARINLDTTANEPRPHPCIPFCFKKKCSWDLHHNSLKTGSYMTKYSCSDHHRGIKHQPQGPVNPLQLSNRPQPRYIPLFQRQKQGARHRAWEGQISINAVISHHDCRIEFCNLLQTCKQPFV